MAPHRSTGQSLLRALGAALCLLALVATSAESAHGAGPVLTLTPDRGPCGSRVVARGADFPPGAAVLLQVGSDNGPIAGRATVAGEGTFTVELSTIGCTASAPAADGTQFRIVASGPGDLRASAVFTVSSSETQCFPETGQCAGGRFLAYWRAHGGLAINGYPLSDEFDQQLEDGKTYRVQYFERVRLELHPENAAPYDVLLGQFGRRIMLQTLGRESDPPAAPLPGQAHFPETEHNLGGKFLAYWAANGGLAQFGYPLSEVFQQRLEDGKDYQVQYFERARFELHPENVDTPYYVLLGQFGRQILAETTPRTLTLDPDHDPCTTPSPPITLRGAGFTPGVTVRFALKRDRDGAIVAADGQTGGRPAAADGTYARTLTLDGCGPDDPAGSTYTAAVFEYTLGPTPALGPGASATFTVTAR